MKIYCVDCKKETEARLTNGKEIYPHRNDLKEVPFWKCDNCKNAVGCHWKTNEPTKPLGIIPNQELKYYRQLIHSKLDPIWKSGYMKKNIIYSKLAKVIGRTYHTAELKDKEECEKVLGLLETIKSI